MDIPFTNLTFSLLILFFSFLSTLSFSNFSPTDNHLINCGSAVDSTIDNRLFVPDDSSSNPNSPLLSSTGTIPLAAQNSSPRQEIYNTARVFQKPSKYKFDIRDPGTHMVRLHFFPLVSSNLNLNDVQFHVLVNGYVVLTNFTAKNVANPVVKEYFIWVNSNELVITFVPAKRGKVGFVNAIEVISAPKDLIADVALLVNGNERTENYHGLTKQALETVYRVNVGGLKVTPFNDTVWRTWVPDDGFFKSSHLSERAYFSGWIKYQKGGASREVGPDFMYGTARVITSTNATVPNGNMTWEFPVVEGYNYLVRLHFCDIASISLGLLYFNVYVNGYLAYENLDLSSITIMLASPFYSDFVVDGDSSGILSVRVGPSNMSLGYAVDGVLNGVEIMKMNNSMGSLDGKFCAGMVLKSWPREHIGVLVPLIAVVCLLVSISMVVRSKMSGMRNNVAWLKLPMDVVEGGLKDGNQNASGKA